MKIGNKELVELFGTDTNKKSYSKNKKVNGSMKESLLSKAKNEYNVVKDLGRGRYEIDGKFDGTIIIPNNKMEHPIYKNLIPAILINVSNYKTNNKVFCLSLNSIYSKFNMINTDNYSSMYNKRKTTSELLDINFDTLNEFFNVTHSSLKYYLEKSLSFLENIGLVKTIKIPYISILSVQTSHKDEDTITSRVSYEHRRATQEEYQDILDIEKEIRAEYGIATNGKLFGKPLIKLKEKLKNLNIDYYYQCYEIFSYNNNEIQKIVEFYGKENLEELSNSFSENFINMTIANAEIRHTEAITQNLKDFYRFSRDYIDDFMKLSNITLDNNHEEVYIPKFKINSEECESGILEININKTK